MCYGQSRFTLLESVTSVSSFYVVKILVIQGQLSLLHLGVNAYRDITMAKPPDQRPGGVQIQCSAKSKIRETLVVIPHNMSSCQGRLPCSPFHEIARDFQSILMSQRVLPLGGRHVTLHVLVLLVHRAASAGGRLRLGEGVILLMLGAVDALLKDGLGLVDLELGLEVAQVVGVATAVGSAALVGPLELLINDFLT